jgi:hypothetical protein
VRRAATVAVIQAGGKGSKNIVRSRGVRTKEDVKGNGRCWQQLHALGLLFSFIVLAAYEVLSSV